MKLCPHSSLNIKIPQFDIEAYYVKDLLGQGGFGEVRLFWNESDNTHVAVKTPICDKNSGPNFEEDMRKIMDKELKSIGLIYENPHCNVIKILGSYNTDEAQWQKTCFRALLLFSVAFKSVKFVKSAKSQFFCNCVKIHYFMVTLWSTLNTDLYPIL